MLKVNKNLLLFFILMMLTCAETASVKEADKWAAFPEYKSLKMRVNQNDLRVYYAPWHDVSSSADAFARTVLRAAAGKNMAGLGCDDNGTACLGAVALRIEDALNASLTCSQVYNVIEGSRKPYFSSSLHDPSQLLALVEECNFHAAALENTIEYEAGAAEEAASISFHNSIEERPHVNSSTELHDFQPIISTAVSKIAAQGRGSGKTYTCGVGSNDGRHCNDSNNKVNLDELVLALANIDVSEEHAFRLAAEEVTVRDLPLLREDHLLKLGIPLGPALRILHAFAAAAFSSTGPHTNPEGTACSRKERSGESSTLEVEPIAGPLWPYGQEGVDWARTPCTPPYCWHACEPIAPSLPRAGANTNNTAGGTTGTGTKANFAEPLTVEEASEWKPEARLCTVAMESSPRQSSAQDVDVAGDLPDVEVQQVWLHPIAIGVPASMVVGCVPRKSRHVAPEKPAAKGAMRGMQHNHNSNNSRGSKKGPYADYVFGPREEHAYRASYQASRLALTIAKSGWDTMRMYEILAAGCVPIFAGLHLSPRGGAMAFLPRALLEMAQRLPGVRLNESVALQKYTSTTGTSEDSPPPLSVDASQFDDTAFRDVAHRLLAFTKRHLTSAAMAAHVLDTCTAHGWSVKRTGGMPWRSLPAAPHGHDEDRGDRQHAGHRHPDQGPVRVLLLGSSSEEDYVRDMLLHGLRSWPSLQVTDARRPNHMYLGGVGGTTSGSPAAESSSSTRSDNGDSSSSNSQHGLVDRSKLYGHGFSYAEWLPPTVPTWQLNEEGRDEHKINGAREVEDLGDTSTSSSTSFHRSAKQQPLPWQRREPLRAAIARRAFDLVIYGSVHRGLPFLTDVTAAYTKEEIAFVDGEDKHGWPSGWCSAAAEFAVRGHFFMREMPNGCPPHLTVST